MALRDLFTEKLALLQDDLLVLSSLVSRATTQSVQALMTRDLILAQAVVTGDQEINLRRFHWEEQALLVLATQSPVASDLRFIAAGMNIVNELERMGDYAKGIARISLTIGDAPLIYPLNPLPEMAQVACTMLQKALTAFASRDAELAEATGYQDDDIDSLYNVVQGELLELMFSNQTNINQANLLLWAAHNLERIGDRITNICERVIFVSTGQLKELPGSHSRRTQGGELAAKPSPIKLV